MTTKNSKKRMRCGTCLTSKLYDEIIKMPSKSHEIISLTEGQMWSEMKALTVEINKRDW
jgi:hypothetical protein